MGKLIDSRKMCDINPDFLEEGRRLFTQPCSFLLGATSGEMLPLSALNEVAFAGRSNVGKSSLINALTGRKALARTSNTPGRTKELNFFSLGKRLMLVDLPGYGFARASKREIKRWNHLFTFYLKNRSQLRRVCLLIDSRRGIMAGDIMMMELLDKAVISYQLILTKCDKTNKEDTTKLLVQIANELKHHLGAHPGILETSSVKLLGIDRLRAELAELATI